MTSAIPPVFEAYATVHWDEHATSIDEHERVLVETLSRHTPEQPWWLGFLETGAHDVVFDRAPRVPLYADWPYVLIEAGPAQTLNRRRDHMRGEGTIPDLFFPQDHSWLVSALWDDGWTCVGGPDELIAALGREPLLNTRRVTPDEDALPPGLTRE